MSTEQQLQTLAHELGTALQRITALENTLGSLTMLAMLQLPASRRRVVLRMGGLRGFRIDSALRLLGKRWRVFFFRIHEFVQSGKRCVTRVGDALIHEFRDPGMAHICLLGNVGPLTASL